MPAEKPFSLCVIGNSHVGAIKEAWDERHYDVVPGFTATFFAAPVIMLRGLRLRGDSLVARRDELRQRLIDTSGRSDRIEIRDYDAFLLVGIEFAIDVMAFAEEYGVAGHTRWGPVKNLVSDDCYAAYIRGTLVSSSAVRIAAELRERTAAPIILCPSPFRPEKVLDEPELNDRGVFRDAALMSSIVSHAKAAGDAIGNRVGCAILWQDESTVAFPGFTKREFGKVPTEREIRSGTPDRRHANAEYGDIVLKAALARLHEMTGGRVLNAKERTAA